MCNPRDLADLTIIVCSCDDYSDLWRPYFTLFFRNWPDCPWKIVLMSNEQVYDDPRVETMAVGQLRSWSTELRAVLTKVTTSHVLLVLEDFFLRSSVNQSLVETCFREMMVRDGNMFRLVRRPGPDRRVSSQRLFGEVDLGAPFRVSTQGAIWRKTALEALLQDGESIWQFEVDGSRRSETQGGYYAVWNDVLTYRHHVVERGRWFRPEARHFGGMGIGCDFSRRPIMTHVDMLRWYKHKIMGDLRSAVPWRWRRTIAGSLRKWNVLADR
jgi:hypothetical protein